MKKAVILFAIVIVSLVVLAGCSHDSKLSLGAYGASDEDMLLQLTIEQEQKFTFAVPVLSIMPSTGSYKIEDTNLILTTNYNSTVVFSIDGKSLIFNQASSSFSENEYPALKTLNDGEVFDFLPLK